MVVCALILVVVPGLSDGAIMLMRTVKSDQGSCRIIRVIDGDTVQMWCTFSGISHARLMGFDTPELFSPRCAHEMIAAAQAKWALRAKLLQSSRIDITHHGRDIYSRDLVKMSLDGKSLATIMITEGYARAYNGGMRRNWCFGF